MNTRPSARGRGDALTPHRMGLEQPSIFRQGVTVVQIALVILVLCLEFKIRLWIDRTLRRDTPA